MDKRVLPTDEWRSRTDWVHMDQQEIGELHELSFNQLPLRSGAALQRTRNGHKNRHLSVKATITGNSQQECTSTSPLQKPD